MGFKSKMKSFFSVEDDYEYVDEAVTGDFEPSVTSDSKNNVVRLESIQSASKVVLVEPTDFDASQEIADHLKNRRAVVFNLQRISHADAKRVVDFLSGCVYAIGGSMQKLGQETFICAPDNVDISGTITELEE